MEDCATHHGFGIEQVFVRCIEALISVEKLRGTDLWLGVLGAPKIGNRSGFGRKFVVQVEVSDGQEFPCGAPMPCTAGSSISPLASRKTESDKM